MSEQKIACHKCQHVWTFEPPLGRRDECPKCHADAKICLNCRNYDVGSHHECREEQAEWVKEKTQGNFCSWFLPNARVGGADEATKAREKLAGLFGKRQDDAPEAPKPGQSLADQLKKFLDEKK